MQYKYILLEKEKDIAILTLNRPNKLNALCIDMIKEINHALSNIDTNNTSAIFILGHSNAFCAGGDLKEMLQLSRKEAERRSIYVQETFKLFEHIKIPTIAFIQGFCFGGGLELALHCDIRICDNNAKFAFPEVKYGMIPGAGGTIKFPITVGNTIANYYLMTGEEFDSDTAKNIRLVHEVVIADGFNKYIENKKEQFNNINNNSLKAIKQIQNTITNNLDSAYRKESELFAELLFNNGENGIGNKFKK
jgi:enoyl-CoA hydratase